MSLPTEIDDIVHIGQVSFFLIQDTLISFTTGNHNPFSSVVDRLRNNSSKLRQQSIDYLMYALIDTTIDFGYPLLEVYAEKIQALEDELLEIKNEKLLGSIHQMRRDILLVRRRLWPQREVINQLLHADDNLLLSETTLLHLRDCYDHVISIMEMLETYHEMTSSLMELYLTSVSLKLNDVMKFLTIFTTIFIPPTFIVGLYGMNFSNAASPLNMPELTWKYVSSASRTSCLVINDCIDQPTIFRKNKSNTTAR